MREWIVSDEDLGIDGAYFSYDEVVRCKDCDKWQPDRMANRNSAPCEEWSDPEEGRTRYTLPNDFCSYAERIKDECKNE